MERVNRMVKAIRKHDERHLITVGVIPWVFTFGGGKPLFHGPRVGKELDFLAVHFHPKKGGKEGRTIGEAITAVWLEKFKEESAGRKRGCDPP